MAGLPDNALSALEFSRRREGMIYAMDGGLWLHRHLWQGRAMAHVVSTDRDRLLAYGRRLGLTEQRLQFKPLKDPRTSQRRDAWHWDLGGQVLKAALERLHVRHRRRVTAVDTAPREIGQ